LASEDLEALEGSALLLSWAFAWVAKNASAVATMKCLSIFASPPNLRYRFILCLLCKARLVVQVFDSEILYFDLRYDLRLWHYSCSSVTTASHHVRIARCCVEAFRNSSPSGCTNTSVVARGTRNILVFCALMAFAE